MILVHGRGATAEDILGLAAELNAADVACIAPQAAAGSWYPYSFMAPIQKNEPGLSSALGVLSRLVDQLTTGGVEAERIALLGFSQGACLALEFAARHATRFAGVFGLSGALIGPPGTSRDYPGNFASTPVLIGCSDIDLHIPLDRVRESADVFRKMGAAVDERIYRGMGHTVNRDELEAIDRIVNVNRDRSA
jgi:phospholipase/carboxylesterase